jgi:predicted RNA-binding protein with TRAM domain
LAEERAAKGEHLVKIEPGKEYTVRIVDRGRHGDGIARVAGMVIFVPETAPGDEVRVLVTKLGTNCAFARKITESEGGESA